MPSYLGMESMQMWLGILRWGDHSGLARWALNAVTGVLVRNRPRGMRLTQKRRWGGGRDCGDAATSPGTHSRQSRGRQGAGFPRIRQALPPRRGFKWKSRKDLGILKNVRWKGHPKRNTLRSTIIWTLWHNHFSLCSNSKLVFPTGSFKNV